MLRQARTSLLVGVGYISISFLYFGWRLLPHPGRVLIGSNRDPQIFVWAFAWFPHAIAAGENPLVTHSIYAPDGINLAWTTTVPALALAFSPLTVLVGPGFSYNVAAVLMPAFAAWTAYLLCRHLTRSLLPALVGGYLFGFSGYMLGQELGHLHMTSVFLVPLVALVAVRYLQGELEARGFAWRLGLLLGLQFWISTEVFLTLTIMLVLVLALGLVFVRETRPRFPALVRGLVGAYAVAVLLAGPLLVYALIGFQSQSINQPWLFNGDLLNFVVPTRLIGIGGAHFAGTSAHFPSSDSERGAYLGVPTLVMIAWYALRSRRTGVGRFVVAVLAASMLLTLGTALTIEGRAIITLPWSWISRLPFFNNILPVRFAVFATLAAAVIVSLWMQARADWLRFALPALAVAVLVPAVWHPSFRIRPERFAFFTDGSYRCIPRNENVAIFPYGFWGDSMLWQAETGFWFRMADGYLRPKPPPANLSDPTIRKLTFTTENPTMAEILAFARNKHVGRILSVEMYVHPNGTQMHRFGQLQGLGGVLVSPACGYPPLTSHSRLLPKWIHGADGKGRYATRPATKKPHP